jgi:glycosyltransferase involved in cell wall biosynthesis
MDVIQVCHRYRPSIGGIENYVHRLHESLVAAGHGSSVVTTDAGLDDAPDRRPEARYCETTAAPLRNPVSRELYRHLRSTDADVYHVHGPFFLTTVEAVHAVPADAPVVMTVHGFPPAFGPGERLRNAAYAPVVRHVLQRVDETVVLGPSEGRRLRERYSADEDAIRVVPNGIHPESYDVPPEAVDRFQADQELDPDTPTLLAVGRLIDWKNPDVLVEAVVEGLPERELDVLVIGGGEPSTRAALRRRADDRFRFRSGLPFEELKAAYHAADLFVHLSESEGLSTVTLEAMNAGLPVVATPPGALADVLVDGRTGSVLSMPPTPEDVARALSHYLDAPDKRAAIGKHNRAYVREQFDWADVAAAIESTYRRLADVKGAPALDDRARVRPGPWFEPAHEPSTVDH